jgi:hypothetical protein
MLSMRKQNKNQSKGMERASYCFLLGLASSINKEIGTERL